MKCTILAGLSSILTEKFQGFETVGGKISPSILCVTAAAEEGHAAEGRAQAGGALAGLALVQPKGEVRPIGCS